MRFATWNVNSLKVRLPQVLQWLADTGVEVLCLQELKMDQDAFPLAEIEAAGYRAVWFGQKTYNGVAILAKAPLEMTDVVAGIPGYGDEQRRVITATVAGVRVICAYFVNGEAVDSPKYPYKLEWLSKLEGHVAAELARHPNLLLLGDYNIAPEDRDVYDPEGWHEQVLCSTPEREAFRRLIALGLSDSFRLFNQEDKQYSWWDYRQMMFRRNKGVRIDHILISDALKPRAQACEIDKAPRKWERPSDHTPVVLTLAD
ncbi:exodeoxyribonuclease III [Chromobacterium phragmitis]|uniref:exodeoxyribonuclease III n=1 Tax=Chromobacterium amazonense TaxID=1382803 RepID=UPI0021B74369|nr:exodeoxyribonuclease III [Chromobacterium amazonense]MBM2885303.1 exodeoxyribonuclease III [Chromobacterium amazonense]MDE1714328.1 exodeoxyribonuclease III [Chromobacterium amazonense]